jgi:hypothetical protein
MTGACLPTLGNGGVIDYGDIRVSDLSSTQVNQLGQKSTSLTITCTSPTKVAYTFTDNKADSAISDLTIGSESDQALRFGLGKTSAGVNLGAMDIYLTTSSDTETNTTIDGEKGYTIHGPASQNEWYTYANDITQNGEVVSFSTTDTSDAVPASITNATEQLIVDAAIQDSSTLNITDTTPLDGSVTISLLYL